MAKREIARYPLRTPRNWHGMTAPVWLRLLARNRFAVSPTRIPMAFAITAFSFGNSLAGMIENLLYGRRAEAVEIEHPPLFIIGHWRTGTTLLHELLVLDEQFNYPTTYQCMAPHHFLHTQRLVTPWFGFLLPRHRPMDNMLIGWDRPQEDEFALCNLGLPSPYLSWAFPRHCSPVEQYLDLEGLSPEELRRWKEAFVGFLKRLTLADPRRLVLKSPTHTARLRTLLELFPTSLFIHIVRNPYVVFPSVIRTWQRLGDVLGLQTGCRDDLEEFLFRLHERMYRRFEQDRVLVDPARICELRYEDLIEDPLEQVSAIYAHLGLGDFERVRPKLAGYVEQSSDYRANKHELTAELRQRIARHWADYITRYGYQEAVLSS